MTAPEPTRPADEHTDAVALDLDGVVAHRDNLAAMIRRLSDFLDGRGLNSWKHGACWAAEDAIKSLTARAEAAEAEVVTLRAKVAAVQALAEKRDVLYPPKWAFGAEENYCNGYRQARADFIAAMATGEGQ